MKTQASHGSEIIAFYNVENLFLPDPPVRHRHDPTPSGLRNWDARKYENKLRKIAHVFRLIIQQYDELPMLIGLCEVQGRKPLEDLVELEPFNSAYGIVHFNSMDERGVDVALLYDKNKIEILSAEPLSYFFTVEMPNYEYYDTTRDVLHCKVRVRGVVMHVFVLHLPSKREKDVNRSRRQYILNDLRAKVSAIVQQDDEPVMICGDFNENPDDSLVTGFLYDADFNKMLINPFAELFQNRMYSTFHYKSGLLFDQILLSRHFTDAGFPFSLHTAAVFNHDSLQSRGGKLDGRPFRTFAGTRYLGGYSDHFPVICQLKNTR